MFQRVILTIWIISIVTLTYVGMLFDLIPNGNVEKAVSGLVILYIILLKYINLFKIRKNN